MLSAILPESMLFGRDKEMILWGTSLLQVTPYQWQCRVEEVQLERMLEGSWETAFLKLRSENASLGRTEMVGAASHKASAYVEEEKTMRSSHGRGIVLGLWENR